MRGSMARFSTSMKSRFRNSPESRVSTGRAQGLGQSVPKAELLPPTLEAGAFDSTIFFLFVFPVALVPPVRRMGRLMPGLSAPLLSVIVGASLGAGLWHCAPCLGAGSTGAACSAGAAVVGTSQRLSRWMHACAGTRMQILSMCSAHSEAWFGQAPRNQAEGNRSSKHAWGHLLQQLTWGVMWAP